MNRIGINTIAFKEELSQGVKQVELTSKIKALGINVMEIRREFLAEKALEEELRELAAIAKIQQLTLFYSVNDEFFYEGQLNPKLIGYLNEAVLLGAERIKFNFGKHPGVFTNELIEELSPLLAFPLKINIENNQTKEHCHLTDITAFLCFCQEHHLNIHFCFDLANWYWTGTSVEAAVSGLTPYTDYVHLKNYKREGEHLLVTSLAQGELSWQTLLAQFAANIDLTLEYNGTTEMLKEDLRLLRDDEK